LWDRFEIPNNPTLKEFLDWFKQTHNLEVQMVSQGVSMLWSSFVAPKKVSSYICEVDSWLTGLQAAERMNMRMSELVENVSKKAIPPWTRNLLVEVMVNDEEDEDVEVSSACC
jgi:ubiquitin-activating enzyme E1